MNYWKKSNVVQGGALKTGGGAWKSGHEERLEDKRAGEEIRSGWAGLTKKGVAEGGWGVGWLVGGGLLVGGGWG